MPQRFYPAVLERGEGGRRGCVGCGRGDVARFRSLDRSHRTARQHRSSTASSHIGATPPDPSERVNVYLPKSLIERVDRLAAERGMNRSSFFGMAASQMLTLHAGRFGTHGPTRNSPSP